MHTQKIPITDLFPIPSRFVDQVLSAELVTSIIALFFACITQYLQSIHILNGIQSDFAQFQIMPNNGVAVHSRNEYHHHYHHSESFLRRRTVWLKGKWTEDYLLQGGWGLRRGGCQFNQNHSGKTGTKIQQQIRRVQILLSILFQFLLAC